MVKTKLCHLGKVESKLPKKVNIIREFYFVEKGIDISTGKKIQEDL
ncbi:MAG: hypothetical protein ABII01_00205 [Candidatus Woesearchaeota archaeon]